MKDSAYKKGLIIVGVAVIIIMTLIGFKLADKEKDDKILKAVSANKDKDATMEIGETKESAIDKSKEISSENKSEDSKIIIVDIDGEVVNPGVYELKRGERVNDAIKAAGGLTENSYTKKLNKARELKDGEKIYIPSEAEAIEEAEDETKTNTTQNDFINGTNSYSSYDSDSNETQNTNSKIININTASKEKLKELPGIGDVYSDRIIEYRNNKEFSTIDEIKNIKGIGEKTFEKIKNMITVK